MRIVQKDFGRSILAIGTVLLFVLTACAVWAAGNVPLPGIPGPRPLWGDWSAARTEEPVPALRCARIRAAGDLMVHRRQLDMALQEDGSYDFHPQYALIADSLADADYTIANLETTVGRQGNAAYSGYPMFNSPETVLEAVRDAGVDFLTLANNHILDRRAEGLWTTVENVERFGFDHGGAYRSPEEKERPVVVDVNGIRVGMLCYTQMTNGMEKSVKREVLDYSVSYLKGVDFEEDVRRLREAGAEVIVAMPHWGQEYRRAPESSTVALAQSMVAAGVDVVLGSHPHMVQPVEFVEAGGRRGLVAYSLGNFISNQGKQYTDSGILLEFTLRERAGGGFDIADVGVVPTFCWRRDGSIQTLPALSCYDAPYEGMKEGEWKRLKASCDDLRKLLGPDIPLLAA